MDSALISIGLALLAASPQAAQEAPSEKSPPLPEWKSPAQEPPAPRPSELLPEEEPGAVGVFLVPRAGAWWTGRFEASTPLGGRTIKKDLLLDNGLDLGLDLGSWGLSLTVDYGMSSDLGILTGGLLASVSFPLDAEESFEVGLAAGPLYGILEVDADGFGDFDPGFGFKARFSFEAWIRRDLALALWIDYRQIEFEYAEPVISGDTDFPGSSFALGGSIILRF